MKITAKTTIEQLCKEFNKSFPSLRLEIYKKPVYNIEEEKKLADISKTVISLAPKLQGQEISFAPNKNAETLMKELDELGLHLTFAFYTYEWVGPSRAPQRKGFYDYDATLAKLNKDAEKKQAQPGCW